MDVIIPAATGPSFLSVVIPIVALAVIALIAACVCAFKYDAASTRASEKKYAKACVALLGVSLLAAISALAFTSFSSEGHSEVVSSAFYEEHNIANLTLSGKDALPLGEAACVGDSPLAAERPSLEVAWTDADGFRHEGTLANMGNIDGECRITLREQAPLS